MKLITIILLIVISFYHADIVYAANTHSIDLERDSTQYLSRTDVSGTTVGGNITLEAWVKVESIDISPKLSTIISVSGGATSPYIQYDIVYQNNSGTPTLKFNRGKMCVANDFVDVVQTLTVGTWYHLALTYDGTTLRGYLDGTEIGSNSKSGNGDSCGPDSTSIGAAANGAVNTFFDGLVDDVRIWTTVRTQTEIDDNKFVEIDSATGLVASWHMNNDLLDSSGNSRTLTNNNSATFSTDIPFGAEPEPTIIPQSEHWYD